MLPGGEGGIRTPQDPPPGKVKNSGGVRAKKARCSLAMESTKKLTNFFFWSFFKQNGTKLEAKLHFFRISSFIGPSKATGLYVPD